MENRIGKNHLLWETMNFWGGVALVID